MCQGIADLNGVISGQCKDVSCGGRLHRFSFQAVEGKELGRPRLRFLFAVLIHQEDLLIGLDDALLHPSDSNPAQIVVRSEEHTSELQSRGHLVCRLLLEKKKKIKKKI